MSKLNRRDMIRKTSAVAVAATAVPFSLPSILKAESKNDRPTIGAIGVGGQGTHDLKLASQFGDVVAICDADLAHAERFKGQMAPKADIYQDYRRLLERKDIDVIIQGTPDHWHTKINAEALLAGKDVYGEKPLTLTIEEAKLLRGIVDETGRVFQTGTQQRSDKKFQTAVELVRNGRIGELKEVWVALPYYSTKGGPFSEEKVPDTLDWDLYQGQAVEHPYNRYRCHQIYRWWYEYAGGIVTDWGNHHVDIAHWGMDCDLTGPVSVESRGLFPNAGNAETELCYNAPDKFFSRMKYANGIDVLYYSALGDQRRYGAVEPCEPVTEEQTNWLFGIGDVPDEVKKADRNGIMFVGDQGRVFVNRGGIYGKPVDELPENPLPADAWRVRPSSDHMGNFFACHKTGDRPVASADIEARTITACHLTNLSIRLDRKLNWDPVSEQIIGDGEAAAMQSRQVRKGYEIDV